MCQDQRGNLKRHNRKAGHVLPLKAGHIPYCVEWETGRLKKKKKRAFARFHGSRKVQAFSHMTEAASAETALIQPIASRTELQSKPIVTASIRLAGGRCAA